MRELEAVEVVADLRKTLLVGAEGTGKTHYIGTMPRPCYVMSFGDKGYSTLAGEPGIRVGEFVESDRYNPTAYKEFEEKFKKLCAGEKYKWPDGREEPYQTIALDSLTFLSTMLFDHLQKINNNVDKPGGFPVYAMVKSKTQDIISKAIAIASYVVCTALIDVKKDEITGEVFFIPNMVGSIANEIGASFDAVFFTKVDKKPTGEVEYSLLTVGDSRHRSKARVPGSLGRILLPKEVPDFKVIKQKIEQAKTQGKK